MFITLNNRFILLLDVETANDTTDALVYDVSGMLIDCYGNVYEQFASATVISGTYMGDACREYRDVTVQNGYDAATFRSRICRVAGCEYSDVGNIQIQKVQVLYKNAKAEKVADFYLTVYEIGGTWYMYELWSIEGF